MVILLGKDAAPRIGGWTHPGGDWLPVCAEVRPLVPADGGPMRFAVPGSFAYSPGAEGTWEICVECVVTTTMTSTWSISSCKGKAQRESTKLSSAPVFVLERVGGGTAYPSDARQFWTVDHRVSSVYRSPTGRVERFTFDFGNANRAIEAAGGSWRPAELEGSQALTSSADADGILPHMRGLTLRGTQAENKRAGWAATVPPA